ncbi:MAG: cytochrome c peroxidase [Gammaproteobacteria bacterium]
MVIILAAINSVQGSQIPGPLSSKDFLDFDINKARIGRLLFYDPILSGNKNIACGTCHNPEFGTSDGLSLGIGEGGSGIGPKRSAGIGKSRIRKRIPRNSQGLWNLGAKEVSVLFHDGRLSISDIYGNGFNSPAEEWLPNKLDNILAAQALFPLTAQFEMAGNPAENQVAGASHDRIDAVWPILAKRIRLNSEYAAMFVAAFEQVKTAADISISEIANAIGAFIGIEWQSYDSPFDAYLAGDTAALTHQSKLGFNLFYGKASCAQCHSGKLLTDHQFHALALPHFGPGRTRRFDPSARDVGHMGESDRLEDAYRFRTPSLRNVALTAPYGHNGAYATLQGIVRHHLDPKVAFQNWRKKDANLPSVPWLSVIDFITFDDTRERQRLQAKIDIVPLSLSDDEIQSILSFLESLTGGDSVKGQFGKPESVPSGLGVD